MDHKDPSDFRMNGTVHTHSQACSSEAESHLGEIDEPTNGQTDGRMGSFYNWMRMKKKKRNVCIVYSSECNKISLCFVMFFFAAFCFQWSGADLRSPIFIKPFQEWLQQQQEEKNWKWLPTKMRSEKEADKQTK